MTLLLALLALEPALPPLNGGMSNARARSLLLFGDDPLGAVDATDDEDDDEDDDDDEEDDSGAGDGCC